MYHEVQGHLCYGVRGLGGIWLWFPIRFKDKAAAYAWIKDGCISQLQEGLGTLQVGFVYLD